MIRYFSFRDTINVGCADNVRTAWEVHKEKHCVTHTVRAWRPVAPIAVPENTPTRVRELYFRLVKQRCAPCPYHAALIDQVFGGISP